MEARPWRPPPAPATARRPFRDRPRSLYGLTSPAVGHQPAKRLSRMRYPHTMLRVRNLDRALEFYCNALGLQEVRRRVDDKGRFTLVFLSAPEDLTLVSESRQAGRDAPLVELTYNWDGEDYGEARYFGHLAYEVDDIYATCDRL